MACRRQAGSNAPAQSAEVWASALASPSDCRSSTTRRTESRTRSIAAPTNGGGCSVRRRTDSRMRLLRLLLVLPSIALQAQTSSPASKNANYVVGAQDVLTVTVFNEPQL